MLVVNYINIYLFTYKKSKCIAYVIFKLKTGYVPLITLIFNYEHKKNNATTTVSFIYYNRKEKTTCLVHFN
jgi:uncharacterized membrane protein